MKHFLIGLVLALAIISVSFFYIKKHWCDNPYHNVCVKSHKITTMTMVPMRAGKVTIMRPMPTVRTICDEYETRLKEECKVGEN